MRRILTILGAIFICLILAGVFVLSGLRYYVSKLDKESKAYIDEVIPIIVTGWNSKELINHASPEFLQVVTDEKIELLFSTLSEQMGPLTEYKGSTGKAKVTIKPEGIIIVANYLAKAIFKNTPAKIEVRTIMRNHNWQIVGFRVILDIDALFKENRSNRIYQFR